MAPDLLGIDFGTSHTVAVLRRADGRSEPLLFDASPLLPSAVYAEADGRLTVGRDAEHSARLDPARFEPNPKRRIDESTLLLGAVETSVLQAITAVLQRVRDEALRVDSGLPRRVVLTHPAGWAAPRRQVLTAAAHAAGLAGAELVPEPVAAATYFTQVLGQRVDGGQALAVYDFGAGTFDISVMRRAGNGWETVAAAGLDDVGGLDLDAAIVGWVAHQVAGRDPGLWRRLADPRTTADRRHRRHLWDDARAAKERLTRSTTAGLAVPLFDLDVHLTRDELERLARPWVERTTALTTATLFGSGVTPDRLAGVFLVGGSSRMPLVATMLHRAVGAAPVTIEQPELVVAQGALYVPRQPPAAPVAAPVRHPAAAAAHVSPPAAPPAAPISPPVRNPAAAAPHAAGLAPRAAPAAPRAAPISPPQSPPVEIAFPGNRPPAGPGKRRRLVITATVAAALVAAAVIAAVNFWPETPARWTDAGSLRGHNGAVSDLAFSLDGSLLATAGADHTVRLWDARTLDQIATLEDHSALVRSVSFSADGKILASGGEDGSMKLWNTKTHKALGTLAQPLPNNFYTKSYAEVAMSPDGHWLAAGYTSYGDNGLELWDVSQQKLVKALPGVVRPVRALAFSGDGGLLALAVPDDDALHLYSAPGWTSLADLPSPGSPYSVVFSADGRTVVTGGAAGDTRLWNVTARTGTLTLPATGDPAAVTGVALSPDGKLVAAGGLDDTVRVWSTADGRIVATLSGDGDVNNVAFSTDGKTLAAATDKGGVRLWKLTKS